MLIYFDKICVLHIVCYCLLRLTAGNIQQKNCKGNKNNPREWNLYINKKNFYNSKLQEKISLNVYSNSVQPLVWAQLTYLVWWLTYAFGAASWMFYNERSKAESHLSICPVKIILIAFFVLWLWIRKFTM